MKRETKETIVTTNILITALYLILFPFCLWAVGYFYVISKFMIIQILWLWGIILMGYCGYFPGFHKKIREKYGDSSKRPSFKDIKRGYGLP